MSRTGFVLRMALVICCLVGCQFQIFAQSEFNTRLWQAEDGLPNNIVQAIAQTTNDYLWAGTREGLAQFDGDQFNLVNLTPESTQPSIICLCGSRDGRLWVGTERYGIFYLNKGSVTHCNFSNDDSDFDIYQILEDGNGFIWFATSRGILRGSQDKIAPVKGCENPQLRICADNTGQIWVLNDGLRKIVSGKSPGDVLGAGILPATARTLYCDVNGVFWIGPEHGTDNELTKVENGVVTNFRRNAGPAGFVSAILRDSEGDMWVGSYAGLTRFSDGKFVSFYGPDEPSYRIYAIFEDKEHNLWIASEEGLTRINRKRFRTITQSKGLSMNKVVSVCPARDGGVWIGTWGGGLNHFLNGNISLFNHSNGLTSDYIMGITETRDGSLWVGTDYDGPLYCIKNGSVAIYGPKQGFLTGLATVTFYEAPNGLLWIGTRNGLQTWDGSKFTRFTNKDGLCNDYINAICGGTGNDVWIGTGAGLSLWHDGKFVDMVDKDPGFREVILSLYRDPQNTLWIGTKWHGLLRLRDGNVQRITRSSGLFSDAIYAIVEDDHTNLWLNSSRGIFYVNKREIEDFLTGKLSSITSVNFGKADGILASGQYTYVSQPAACKDDEGRMWFRTTQGIVYVDPNVIAINHQPPPVMIQELLVDNNLVVSNKFGGGLPHRIVIPPSPGNLEIRYAALSYSAPEKNLYRYRIEGLDNNWINAGNNRAATYNHLRPGNYRFQVTACNNDGIWNDQGQSIDIFLKPHFWQTWWFFVFCGITTAGILGGSVRHWTRLRMQRKLMQLEQRHAVERERARIARDVHDELGSKLTQISFQGSIAQCSLNDTVETQRQIEQMSASAREAVSSLQEIIWATDPENDSLEGLIGHISHFAGQFFNASTINCEVSAPEFVPDVRISAALRHNLFLAIKEAVNNAAKHAQANRILVQMIIRTEQLEIQISDNGGGFDAHEPPGELPDKTRRMGYGLSNMRERLTGVGGRCEISSESGQGTTVRFIIPLGSTTV
ncbi:MAG TPA: two-component regulator propeller domain-containing protein [Verrucomicrobiae bacterium]